jgi:hypothetical protein
MGSFRIFETMSKAIEADPEPWNAPHREAMAWYDYRDRFQGFVVDQNAIHSFISSHIRSWEQGIEDGTIEYTSEDEERYLSICRSLLSVWLDALPKLDELVGQESISGVEEFRANVRQANDYCDRAERIAARQRSVGMRDVQLTHDEAATLGEIISGANSVPDEI